jgi:hypothetical protein
MNENFSPWPNLGRGDGISQPRSFSVTEIESQASFPSATKDRAIGSSSAISFVKKSEHVAFSSVVGLLSGGAQRTAQRIRVSISS